MKKEPKITRLPQSTARGTLYPGLLKRVPAVFYRTATGNEPVRDWLKAMISEDRKRIGEDIKTVEFGWPVGMPICRSMGDGLNEVRTNLSSGKIARIFFYIDEEERMILLHGIIKKSQSTPTTDLTLARRNKKRHEESLK